MIARSERAVERDRDQQDGMVGRHEWSRRSGRKIRRPVTWTGSMRTQWGFGPMLQYRRSEPEEAPLFVGRGHLAGAALDEHAPPGARGRVVAVDLEADRRAAIEPAQLLASLGPEHDGLAVDDVVDRVDLGGAVDQDADAPDGGAREQVPALALREVLHPGLAVDDRHGSIKRPNRGLPQGRPGHDDRDQWPY